MAGLAVFHLLTVRNAQCFIAAADVEQAKEMFRFAQHYCESEPDILRIVKITESTRLIRARRGGGRIKVLASDKSTGGGKRHSYSPTLALIDELHAHENTSVYTALRSAAFKGRRPESGLTTGIVAVISTAGHNVNSVLGTLRAEFLKADQRGGNIERGLNVEYGGTVVKDSNGRLTIATTANQRNVMLEWACRDGSEGVGLADDLGDMETVKFANPASFVTPESLQDALEAPGITPWDFSRYRANVWTMAFRSWIPTGAWDPLADTSANTEQTYAFRTYEPKPGESWDEPNAAMRAHIVRIFPPDTAVIGALDMARYRDCAALVLIGKHPDWEKPRVRSVIWQSGGQDNPVPYDAPKAALRATRDAYANLRTIGWDPKYADQLQEDMVAEGVPMEAFPQSNERMAPAAAELRMAILTGAFEHDGDPILRAHVLAGSAKDVGAGQFKIVKAEGTGPPIDGGVALAMAWALSLVERPKPSAEWW